MKYLRPLTLTLGLCASLVLCLPVSARDIIEAIDVKMAVSKDSSIVVSEKIYVNFDRPRKGITRVIPLQFASAGLSHIVDFHLSSVKDESDHAVSAAIDHRSGEVVIDIGQDEKAVKGQHNYTVNYTLRRAASHVDRQPEIYWPVSGSGWTDPINQVSLTMKLPAGVNASDVTIEPHLENAASNVKTRQLGDEVYVQAFDIQPGSGLAVTIKLPHGAIVAPRLTSVIGWWSLDWYPALLFPLLTFLALFATWYHLGRDEEANAADGIVSEPPQELSPAEMGVIVDERADHKDIVSIVLDLAVRGYFNVMEVEGDGESRDYIFERKFKALGPELKPFEIAMLRALFRARDDDFAPRINLSTLREDRAMSMSRFSDLLYGGMAERGWFKQNVEVVRATYMRVGGLVLVLSAFMMVTAASTNVLPLATGSLLSAVLIILFGRAMPSRTLSGVRLRRRSLAFARFIEQPDKATLRALSNKNPGLFESYLPYALVLNEQNHWAEQFDSELSPDCKFVPLKWLQAKGCDTAPGSTAAANRLIESLIATMHLIPAPNI